MPAASVREPQTTSKRDSATISKEAQALLASAGSSANVAAALSGVESMPSATIDLLG